MQDNEQLILKALEAIKANDQMLAAEYLEDVLKADPENDKAWIEAAKLFDDPKKQIRYARKALKANPENLEAKYLVKSLPEKIKKEKELSNTVQFLEKLLPSFLVLFAFVGVIVFFALFMRNRPSEPITPSADVIPNRVNELEQVSTLNRQFSINDRNLNLIHVPQMSSRAQTGTISAPSISANGQFVSFKNGNQIHLKGFAVGNQAAWLVSRNWKGLPSNGVSSSPIISNNGQYTLFESTSSDFWETEEGIDGKNLYLYNRQTNSLELISRKRDNTPLNADIDDPFSAAISADGQIIVYQSAHDEVVPNDSNGKTDIFMFSRATRETTRISIKSEGTESNGASINPDISGNGRYVVFASNATNLGSKNWHEYFQIYIHDLTNGDTEPLVVDFRDADKPQISYDGTMVAYLTIDIDRAQSNFNDLGLVVFDREENQRQFLFEDLGANYGLDAPTIQNTDFSFSPDGQFIVIGQSARYLDYPEEGAGIEGFFIFDLKANSIKFYNILNDGRWGTIYAPDISNEGKAIVFLTGSDELIDGQQKVYTRVHWP